MIRVEGGGQSHAISLLCSLGEGGHLLKRSKNAWSGELNSAPSTSYPEVLHSHQHFWFRLALIPEGWGLWGTEGKGGRGWLPSPLHIIYGGLCMGGLVY